jgi:DUF1680 family protein
MRKCEFASKCDHHQENYSCDIAYDKTYCGRYREFCNSVGVLAYLKRLIGCE